MPSITRRGDKWHVRIRRKGIQSRAASFIRKIDAERWAAQIEADVLSGSYRGPTRKTMGELFGWYRDTILPTRSDSSTDRYRLGALERRLTGPVGAVDQFTVVRYARQRLADGVAADTVRREIGLISDAFNSASAFGFVGATNPVPQGLAIMRKLRLLAPSNRRERRLRPGEEEKLAAACNVELRDIAAFAIAMPLRQAEIFRMRRQDVDWQKRTLTIWRSKTDWKTGEHGRVVPILSPAFELLQQRVARLDGMVWHYRSAHSISQGFRRLCEQAGIRGLHFHDLRHEAISRLFERGYTIVEVAVFSGHKDWRSLKRYTHPSTEYLLRKQR